MRKVIAVATLSLVLGTAAAAGPADDSPEGRAYVGFSFGGTRIAPRDLHYGLRFDHDSRWYADRSEMPAPYMQFDFTTGGLADARVNGLTFLKKSYRQNLAQDQPTEQPAESPPPSDSAPAESPPPAEAPAESPPPDMSSSGGEAAAPAEDEGFFSGMWHGVTHFFGGLFGGDDEEKTEQPAQAAQGSGGEAGPTETPAPEGELAEGTFMGYNAIDWAVLAVGAVGLGYVASEVTNGDEDPDTKATSSGSGGGGGGGGGGLPCIIPPNIPPGCTFTETGHGKSGSVTDPEYQEWLDGGTGHMGDLGN